jgi:hypothetical protein
MIRYCIWCVIQSLGTWLRRVRAARSMDKLLRKNGFTEVSPGRWEKPIEPPDRGRLRAVFLGPREKKLRLNGPSFARLLHD